MKDEELDITTLINLVLKRFWLIAAMALVGLVAAILVNVFMRPVYEATTLMMINQENAGKLDDSPYGSFASMEDYYRTQYQLLGSRSLLESVYKQLDLRQYEEFSTGLGRLRKAIKIDPVTRSRLVNVRARSYDPNLAAEISNTLANNFVQENVSNRISMGQDIIRALESTETSDEEQELLNSMPQVVNSDFIKSLKQQEASLDRTWAQLSAKYTPQHPEVVSVKRQLAATKAQIALETRRLVQSIKIELSGQFSGNNVRIVDPAVVPSSPILPRKLINIAVGLLGGAILGVLLVFLLEFLDQTVKSSEDLEKKLNLPFLGFVPYEKSKKKEAEYASMLKEGNILLAENVRNIRTMLDFTLADDRQAPVLISSSMQGEGKSNLSSNLAVALAQTGKKVLLIDGDLRRCRLHKVFKVSPEKGLSNIWDRDAAKADYASNVQPAKDVPNLFIMTAGQRPPNPTELLNTPRLADFIAWAQKNYDHVLVDCPAILPVADTMLWGKYIPRTVFVIRYGKTNARAAQMALDKLQKAGVKVLGAVIGHYKAQGLSYGKYGYYKSYSYYYSNDDEKK
ncbi:MAG: polysaccharide biosynthesis tyrosine autokinase [Elusimicrobiaceae bacterium]|nr:polysaccharide biosynthesis tyrosine autokinase [Elusimicrobiaceae bacterium]MBP5617093.1 polysaccharide biosynthesis tyrosine autokinase [Elusimicrobiaceae bacterium]